MQYLPRSYSRGGYAQLRRWHYWRDAVGNQERECGRGNDGAQRDFTPCSGLPIRLGSAWKPCKQALRLYSGRAFQCDYDVYIIHIFMVQVQAGADGGHPDDAPWG